MLRCNGDPEYRRRIREKTRQNQESAHRKRDEASREGDIKQITAAIHRVEQELNRTNDENAPEKKRDRYWERGGIVGLWAAAAVGVAAIWIGNHDAYKQRTVMESQLGEMRSASEATKR